MSIGFKRLWTLGLLGAWLSIFAGNAAAYCTYEPELRGWVCDAPFVSITSPANGARYTLPVSFPVTATVDNGGQAIAKVDFYVNGTVFQTFTTAPYSATYTPTTPGTYWFSAVATEINHGTRTGYSSAVSVTVNSAPVVSITSPANNASFTTPAIVSLTASATDSDGTISKVEFYDGATFLGQGSASGSNYFLTWNNVSVGSHAVTAKATDNRGAVTTSGSINLTVIEGSASATAVPNGTAPVGGSLPGTAGVGVSGAAAYSIPIAVPPGTAGIAPNLSLIYSSQGGEGLMGIGWSVGGLSSITRCPRTLVQDNYAGRVSLAASDRYCLDGQRLILVSGTYGATAEYRTEIDGFSKITSTGADANKGPDSFTVYSKFGKIISYGTTPDSYVEAQGTSPAKPLKWLMAKVIDRKGNYLSVSYIENTATGESYPNQIVYTGNATISPVLPPYNAVRFVWGPRPDGIVKHVAGAQTAITQRLINIQTYVNIDANGNNGALARDYRIGYIQSSQSNRSLVSTVAVCESLGNCLPATQFTWQQRSDSDNAFNPAVWGGPVITFSTQYPALELDNNIVFGDFDGDGKQDLVYSTGNGSWNVCLSTGSNFSCSSWPGPAVASNNVLLGDFDGDGKTDIALPPSGNNYVTTPATWQICLSTGNGFNCQNWQGYTVGGNASRYVVGDFTGDGRADIGMAPLGGGSYLCASTGSAGSGFTCVSYGGFTIVGTADDPARMRPNLADINGDGRQDILLWDNGGVGGGPWWDAFLAADAGFGGTSVQNPPGTTGTYYAQLGGSLIADLERNGYGALFATYSTSTGSITGELCRYTGASLVCSPLPQNAVGPGNFGDVDGDGRPDLWVSGAVCQAGLDQTLQNAVTCDNWSTPIPPASSAGGPLGDYNGDGKVDYAYYDTSSNQWIVGLAGGPRPDLLSAVVNGVGSRTEFSYKPLTDNSVYTKDSGANAAAYPQRDVQDATYVVSQTRGDNGIGGLINTDYRYGGKKTDLTGRGDLGFRWMEATNSVNHVTTRTEYAQIFPYTGMATSSKATHSSGVVLAQTDNALAQQAGSAASALFPFVSQNVATTKDLDTSALGTSTTNGIVYDAYGNLTNVTVTTVAGGETFTTATATNYFPADTANWLVGLPTQVQITKTAPGIGGAVNSVTRTSTFDYYAGTNLLFHENVEAADATYKLTTTYTRDGYGNVTQRTLNWTDPVSAAAQTRDVETVTVMDGKGRWPLTVKNALNQTEIRVYDDSYGNLASLTGPNNLVTAWLYDGFGRKIRETRADNAYTTWAYKQCVSGCGFATSTTITQNYGTDNLLSAVPSQSYVDSLSREVLSQTWGFDGTEIRAEKEYDSLGRLTRSARPRYPSETPAWTTLNIYDDLGRPTQVTDPDGMSTFAYHGLSVTTVNQKGQNRTEVKNGLGKRKTVTDANGKITSYVYDPFANLLQTIDAKLNRVTIAYDKLGRKTNLADPDLGAWQYFVDPLGQTYRQIDAKNQVTTFTYDALGRMTQRLEPDLNSNWVYDTATKGIGKLAEAYTLIGGGAKDYRRVHGYDSLGRAAGTTVTLDQDYVSSTLYDGTSGRVSSVTHQRNSIGGAGGPSVTFNFGYNGYGFLWTISGGGTIYWQVLGEDALGRVTQETLGNGLTTTHGYNPTTARLESIRTGPNGTASVQNDVYLYDSLGNLSSRSQLNTLPENFAYDSLNRLTNAQVGSQVQKTYAYDEIGNLASKSDVGTYTYPASGTGSVGPHAVASIAGSVNGTLNPVFQYDNNGNLLSGPGRTFTWMSFNMPQAITQGAVSDAFVYGPEHQRAKQTQSTVKTLYYAGAMEKEIVSGTSTVKTYLPSGLGVIIDNGASALTRYFHKDHLGSVTAITREDGSPAEAMSYDPFGKRRNLDGSDDPGNSLTGATDNKGYTGHEMLDNVRLVHMNGRVYDPSVARFPSADPIVSRPDDAQSFNRYSYVVNNPLKFTDPTGYEGEITVEDSPTAPNNANKPLMGSLCWNPSCSGMNLIIIQIASGWPSAGTQSAPAEAPVGSTSQGSQSLYQMGGTNNDPTQQPTLISQDTNSNGRPAAEGSFLCCSYSQSISADGIERITTTAFRDPAGVSGLSLAQAFPPTIIFGRPPVTTFRPEQLAPLNTLPKGAAGGPGAGKVFPRSLRDKLPDDVPCTYCGKPTTREPGPDQLQGDHIIPRGQGGNNTEENFAPSCRTCNGPAGKWDRTPLEWYRLLGIPEA